MKTSPSLSLTPSPPTLRLSGNIYGPRLCPGQAVAFPSTSLLLLRTTLTQEYGPWTEEKHRLGKMSIICPNVPQVSAAYGECRLLLRPRPPADGPPRPHGRDAAFAICFCTFLMTFM